VLESFTTFEIKLSLLSFFFTPLTLHPRFSPSFPEGLTFLTVGGLFPRYRPLGLSTPWTVVVRRPSPNTQTGNDSPPSLCFWRIPTVFLTLFFSQYPSENRVLFPLRWLTTLPSPVHVCFHPQLVSQTLRGPPIFVSSAPRSYLVSNLHSLFPPKNAIAVEGLLVGSETTPWDGPLFSP